LNINVNVFLAEGVCKWISEKEILKGETYHKGNANVRFIFESTVLFWSQAFIS
jgi:hypothetical protein